MIVTARLCKAPSIVHGDLDSANATASSFVSRGAAFYTQLVPCMPSPLVIFADMMHALHHVVAHLCQYSHG